MTDDVVIQVNNVSKKFKSQVVLKDITLQCRKGRIYGFVGYNGSGKTVLFKCICGLLYVDAGEIRVNGEKIGREMIKNAGIIIEEPAFLGNESGRKNLELLYMLRHKRDKKRIADVMQMLGLNSESKKTVRQYSLGMRQRLGIAQAIMEKPDILVLDEPMNALDKNGVEEMRRLFLKMKSEGKLILLTSHNREDIEILCDEVYEIKAKKVCGTSDRSGNSKQNADVQ